MPNQTKQQAGTRRKPADDKHLRKYPFAAAAKGDVEFQYPIPAWASTWNQRHLGACVGFSTTMALSLANELQAREHKNPPYTRVYDAVSVWWQARLIDEFSDNDDLSDPRAGTTLRAGLEVLRTTGPKLIQRGIAQPPDPEQGIDEYRWGKTIDHLRAAVAARQPVVLGIEAWQGLGSPVKVGGEFWIGESIPTWERGLLVADHAVAVAGVSDKREAVLIQNSWGSPPVWWGYADAEKEISEIAITTDRPTP